MEGSASNNNSTGSGSTVAPFEIEDPFLVPSVSSLSSSRFQFNSSEEGMMGGLITKYKLFGGRNNNEGGYNVLVH